MNIKRIFLMELGMAVIGLAGILAYKRSVKRYGRIVETPAVIDKVGNDAEELVPSQVPLSTKRTRSRTKITRGMVREWYLASKKGMTHREIATMYVVSLVTVDRHLADVNRRQAVKNVKSPVCLTVPTDDAVIKQDLSTLKNHIDYE